MHSEIILRAQHKNRSKIPGRILKIICLHTYLVSFRGGEIRFSYLNLPSKIVFYFRCVICNKSFSRSGILKKHQLTHQEHMKFKCSKCDKRFIEEKELEKHFSFVHNKPRPFACNLCEKAFTFKQGLERHMTGELIVNISLIIHFM